MSYQISTVMKRVSRSTSKKTSKKPSKFTVAALETSIETPQEAENSDSDNELSVSTPITSSSTIETLKGYGAADAHGGNHMDHMPRFDGKAENWERFAEALNDHLKDTNHNEELDIYKTKFGKTANRQLYSKLVNYKTLPTEAYNLIYASYKHDGKGAFKALEQYYLGPESIRRANFIEDLIQLRLGEAEDIRKFIARIQILDHQDRQYGVLKRDGRNGEKFHGDQMIIQLACKGLPAKYHSFDLSIRSRNTQPSIPEFCELLSAEAISLSQINKHQSKNETVMIADSRPSKSKKRKRKNEKRARNDIPSQGQTAVGHDIPMNAVGTFQGRGNMGHRGRGGGQGRGNHNNNNRQGQLPSNNNNYYNQRNNGYHGQRTPITCTRCLSRDGSHNQSNCKSSKWCKFCRNASHSSEACYKQETPQ